VLIVQFTGKADAMTGSRAACFSGWRVLDGDEHPSITHIRQRARHKQTILGYLSLCELGPGKPYKADLVREGLILGPHPKWPGSFYIDIRRPAWRERVVKQLGPALLAQGFDGLFLDTIDDAPWLDSEAPVALRAPGTSDAAVALVRALRAQFPGRPIMLSSRVAT
jgi:endo-alpha-1,4-polygalactosaminidase (GH114 family)